MNKEEHLEMLILDLENNSLGYWDSTQNEMAEALRGLQQENKQLKEQLSNNGLVKTCENCEWFGVCPHSYKEYDYKNIIDELEKWLEENWKQSQDIWFVKIINKLKELKGIDK